MPEEVRYQFARAGGEKPMMDTPASTLLMWLAVVGLPALFCTGCGNDRAGSSGALMPPAGWPSVEERSLAPGDAPTPFTAAQIRTASPDRLVITSLVEEPSGRKLHQMQRFDGTREEGAIVTFYRTDLAGKSLGAGASRPWRWEELRRQAQSVAADTQISQETIDVPAGRFECMLYVVRSTSPKRPPPGGLSAQGKGEDAPVELEAIESRLWYAYDLPGPPVRLIRKVDGVEVLRMTLVSRGQVEAGDEDESAEK